MEYLNLILKLLLVFIRKISWEKNSRDKINIHVFNTLCTLYRIADLIS